MDPRDAGTTDTSSSYATTMVVERARQPINW
jgi:hypothetical protein